MRLSLPHVAIGAVALAATLSLPADAEKIRLCQPSTGGGGGTPSPTRDDVANSYTATTSTGPALQTQALECAVNANPDAPGYCFGVTAGGELSIGTATTPVDVQVPGLLTAATGLNSGAALAFTGTAPVNITNITVGMPVAVVDADGLAINQTTPIKGVVLATVNADVGSMPAEECVATSVTVTGAVLGDYVEAQAQCDLSPSVFTDGARVTAANTVSMRVCNLSSTNVEDPPACDYRFLLMR